MQSAEEEQRRRVAAKWSLRRRQAKLHAEFEFLSRECLQLCQKRFLKAPVESIELTEIEQKFLWDLKERKLKEVVSKQCSSVIKFLMSQKFLAYPFNEPVDTVMYRDYLNYVRTPMDFGTIKGKIGQYKTPEEFEADVRLVFENARKYNAPETEVREMARLLEMKFDEKWTKSVLPRLEELKASEIEDQIAFKQSKADNVTMEAETRVDECCRLLLNRLQALAEEIKYVQCLVAAQCASMSEHERLRLGWELTTLPPEQFQHAVNLVLMRHPGMVATMKDNTVEFNMGKMDCLTLRLLQDYVRHCLREKERAESVRGPLETPPVKKRRRHVPSPERKDEMRSNHSAGDGEGLRWPEFAFGTGLKPYAAEVEPFIPPSTEETSSLPLASLFMNHSASPIEMEMKPGTSPVHIKLGDSPQSPPVSGLLQMPVFLPVPSPQLEQKTELMGCGERLAVSEESKRPTSPAVSMSLPQSLDAARQGLAALLPVPLPAEAPKSVPGGTSPVGVMAGGGSVVTSKTLPSRSLFPHLFPSTQRSSLTVPFAQSAAPLLHVPLQPTSAPGQPLHVHKASPPAAATGRPTLVQSDDAASTVPAPDGSPQADKVSDKS